jgi:hypothetical protein
MRMDYSHDWVDVSVDWYGREGPHATISISGRDEDHATVILSKWYLSDPVMTEDVYWDIRNRVEQLLDELLTRQFVLQLRMPFGEAD